MTETIRAFSPEKGERLMIKPFYMVRSEPALQRNSKILLYIYKSVQALFKNSKSLHQLTMKLCKNTDLHNEITFEDFFEEFFIVLGFDKEKITSLISDYTERDKEWVISLSTIDKIRFFYTVYIVNGEDFGRFFNEYFIINDNEEALQKESFSKLTKVLADEGYEPIDLSLLSLDEVFSLIQKLAANRKILGEMIIGDLLSIRKLLCNII